MKIKYIFIFLNILFLKSKSSFNENNYCSKLIFQTIPNSQGNQNNQGIVSTLIITKPSDSDLAHLGFLENNQNQNQNQNLSQGAKYLSAIDKLYGA